MALVVISGCTVNISLTANPAGEIGQSIPTQSFETPSDLTSLHLTGRLVYLSGSQQGGTATISIESLDFATGATTTIFQTAPPDYLYAASVSPDKKKLVFSYSTNGNFPALYLLPVDGLSSPQRLFAPAGRFDQYTEPVWSPDGKYIYFVHTNFDATAQKPNQPFPINEIQRLDFPSGSPEVVAANAYWPRLSLDGTRLIYVSQNPQNNRDQLTLADPNGGHPARIQLSGPDVPTVIDAPLLLPDEETILFSAPTPQPPASMNWLDRLLGLQNVSAHTVPSEWWSVPLTGGKVTQLTHIEATSLYGSISPDRTWLASFSGNGLFLMHPDGTGLAMVVDDVGGISGTVEWIP